MYWVAEVRESARSRFYRVYGDIKSIKERGLQSILARLFAQPAKQIA
jgi:hypothetical protein